MRARRKVKGAHEAFSNIWVRMRFVGVFEGLRRAHARFERLGLLNEKSRVARRRSLEPIVLRFARNPLERSGERLDQAFVVSGDFAQKSRIKSTNRIAVVSQLLSHVVRFVGCERKKRRLFQFRLCRGGASTARVDMASETLEESVLFRAPRRRIVVPVDRIKTIEHIERFSRSRHRKRQHDRILAIDACVAKTSAHERHAARSGGRACRTNTIETRKPRKVCECRHLPTNSFSIKHRKHVPNCASVVFILGTNTSIFVAYIFFTCDIN